MLDILSEKIIELGIDLGLECLSTVADDAAFSHEYKEAVEELLETYWDRFKLSSMDEEFDYQGLCNYLRSSSTIDYVKVAISGTLSERKRARARIYQEAYRFADVRTTESKEQVRRMVCSILETLRTLGQKKIPLKKRVINAAMVDEINSHSDNNTKAIYEAIKNVEDIIKASEKKVPSKQYDSMYSAMLNNGGEIYEEGCLRFNLNAMNREILGFADEEEIQFMREQLGDRISGNESREEIITLFWAETKMAFQSGKRFEVMPIFQNIVRDSCTASIYTDHVPRVVDRVQLARFYWDEFDIFHIQGNHYILRILMRNNIPAEIMMFYNFGVLPDVNDRLYYFERVDPIVKAHSIQIIGQGIEEYRIELDMEAIGEEWKEHTERTKFWIAQMNKVAEIERFYQIHFDLPGKATEEEYISIDILSASVHRRCCRTLPGFPKEVIGEGDGTAIEVDKEIPIGCSDCLVDVTLFGYVFKPIKEYIIPCDLHWHEDKQCFETDDGGIPTGVEFKLLNPHPIE